MVYPEKVAMALNFGVALIFLLTMFKDINWNHSKNSGTQMFTLEWNLCDLTKRNGVLLMC